MDQAQSLPVDERHEKRVHRFQALFAFSFERGTYDPTLLSFIEKFREYQEEIDRMIQQAAPEWPIDQINRVDVSVMRVVLLESMTSKTPKKVLLDEAVEIAKEYGTESSPKFVNGVLGKLLIDSE